MFYVNDDDIESLFRTAAENYDINAEQAADFNGVLKALSEDGGGEEQKPAKKKRRFLVFWWFVVLPLIGLLLWNSTLFRNNDQNGLVARANSNNNAATQPNNPDKDKVYSAPNEKEISQSNAASATTDNALNPSKDNSLLNTPVVVSAKNSSQEEGSKTITGADALMKSHAEQMSINSTSKQDLVSRNNLQKTGAGQQPTAEQAAALALLNENKKPEITTGKIEPKSNISDTIKNSVAIQFPTKDSASKTVSDTKAAKKTSKLKSNYFYAGAAASVDLTFIKFQKTTKPGFNAGIVAGYRFNKKWQLETGLILDKKNYYTKGDYFDKSKVPYLNWVDLKSVSGYCNMYEIQLNARFNFNEIKNHTWFASAGISSYLMKKEYYNYGYNYNGSYHNRDYTYTTSEKDWAAVINLSAGYELKAGTKNYLRFEPYYKIPVKGVGTGSLPLSSAGLNVAFTRRIP